MNAWNLECRNCRKSFQHSIVAATGFDLLSVTKPGFPQGGSELECPHCCQKFLYQRHELFYSA